MPNTVLFNEQHFLPQAQLAAQPNAAHKPDFHLVSEGKPIRRANSSAAARGGQRANGHNLFRFCRAPKLNSRRPFIAVVTSALPFNRLVFMKPNHFR